jgi:hypothetical protein
VVSYVRVGLTIVGYQYTRSMDGWNKSFQYFQYYCHLCHIE